MKNIAALLLGIAFILSCNSKNENHDAASGYGINAVGVYHNGQYTVTDIEAVKIKWEEAVKKELHIQDSVNLENFLIEKAAVQGKDSKECYLLTATAKNEKIAIGALLVLQNNTFYLDAENAGNQLSTGLVICKGSCGGIPCRPAVLSRGGEFILICSSCRDCSKTVTEVDVNG